MVGVDAAGRLVGTYLPQAQLLGPRRPCGQRRLSGGRSLQAARRGWVFQVVGTLPGGFRYRQLSNVDALRCSTGRQ